MSFDKKGHLYFSVGERGKMENSQNLGNHSGKVFRINDDGSVPADNPFINNPDAKPEIYSYGHRNPQGMAVHPLTGKVWTHEHGPQGGDEINIARSGRNYGWPVITHGVNYGLGSKIGEGKAKTGLEQPLYVWVPSIAPSGMSFVSGAQFPDWQGDLLIGALREQSLIRLKLDGEKVVHEERLLKGQVGRVRDIRTGPDGLIYLLTDASDGALMRLEPDNP
jgi:glucose/arabinose dehydrogenase